MIVDKFRQQFLFTHSTSVSFLNCWRSYTFQLHFSFQLIGRANSYDLSVLKKIRGGGFISSTKVFAVTCDKSKLCHRFGHSESALVSIVLHLIVKIFLYQSISKNQAKANAFKIYQIRTRVVTGTQNYAKIKNKLS